LENAKLATLRILRVAGKTPNSQRFALLRLSEFAIPRLLEMKQ